MVAGSYRPLEDAFRIAHTQLIRWICAETDLSLMDTYQLVTQASRSPIANVCDANYTIVAKMPKRYLPADTGWMGDAHERLRRIGAAVRASSIGARRRRLAAGRVEERHRTVVPSGRDPPGAARLRPRSRRPTNRRAEPKLTPQLSVATLAGMLRRILHPPTDDAPDDPDRPPAADDLEVRVAEPDLAALTVVGITRRRIAIGLGVLLAAWILVVFARQVSEAAAATGRAEIDARRQCHASVPRSTASRASWRGSRIRTTSSSRRAPTVSAIPMRSRSRWPRAHRRSARMRPARPRCGSGRRPRSARSNAG